MYGGQAGKLLILDIDRFGRELEQVLGSHQRITLLGVVVVKKFEAGVLDRFGHNVVLVGIALQPRGAPTVHVHDDLHLWPQDDLAGVGHTVAGEAVHHEDLGRQVVLLDQILEIAGGIICKKF